MLLLVLVFSHMFKGKEEKKVLLLYLLGKIIKFEEKFITIVFVKQAGRNMASGEYLTKPVYDLFE